MDEFVTKRQRDAMAKFELDALVAFSKENVCYGAEYMVPSQALGLRSRQFAVAANADGDTAMLLTTNERPEAESRSSIHKFYSYDEFTMDPMVSLAGILEDLGVAKGRIGLELDALTADRWEALQRAMPNGKFVPATNAFDEARKVKSPREQALLRKAAGVADLAQLEAHKVIREGMTEQELYRLMVDRALANEAEVVLMVQVAAGERTTFSNPTPSERQLKRGDVVKIDVFVSVGGYLSDTGRAFVVGEATPYQKQVWSRAQETLDVIEDMMRPGVSTQDVWQTFLKTFKKYEMEPAIRFLGHGLGLSLHEEPYIAAHADSVLEAGMVMAVEPIYKDDRFSYHIEDNIMITENGIENFTSRLSRDLIVVAQ
jgi:Xaa-Pro dipeptidase